MPRTIDEGFRDFLATLTPSSTESSAAQRHRQSIEGRLRTDYTLYRFLRIGSFGNATSVCGFSDVDYLAEVSGNDLSSDSNYCLRKLCNSLETRFPNTGVCVRCPAVLVPFGSEWRDDTEVVLAFDTGKTSGGHPIYGIADGVGGWMSTAPDAHKGYVLQQDKRLGGKVRPLIRFVKAWKFNRSVPISSFYLEMRVAEFAATESSIYFSTDVKRFLCWLLELGLARQQDPCGVSGYIPACKTDAQYSDALSKLETAATRATNALECENAGKSSDAFEWWRLLYDNAFPTYYR